ncbi:DUF805 domain-containing protein [Erwinia sp. Leaf53]|uniref:DUF805 domain-containing protein n=1 Tax=Erwinia sp. Leaf53 TaxID=1736225 RepID=UPI0006FA1122|nr:DUF805 domain-containing protein [Erwinia sp. Leaf53]KQN63328.1 hypothetical protein ASF13_20200 [Erwinia sp. Leaf53]
MTLQHWCFSFRGRLRRRDFWIWQTVWLLLLTLLFTLASNGWLDNQTAAFCVVALLWPTSAVLVKRLHDRNKGGQWALLLILAWMLMAGNWAMLPGEAQWVVGHFIPALIMVSMLVELGGFSGTAGDNRFGKMAQYVVFLPRRAA